MKVLLVEDDKALSAMYAKKFAAEGFDVTITHSGLDAVSKAKEEAFDVAVLDIMLPGMSGINVLEMLRLDPATSKLPIIVYTNYGDKHNREKCLTIGADDFILKIDTTPELLAQTIRRAAK